MNLRSRNSRRVPVSLLVGLGLVGILASAFEANSRVPRAENPSDVAAVYADSLAVLHVRRASLQQAYTAAGEGAAGDSILQEAGTLLTRAVADRIFPFWYGTRWSFNGTTQTPGTGSIACGYFVTTVLRDAGVSLARERLAQEASEVMIRALVARGSIKRFSDVPIETFVDEVRDWGEGLYVVGLDIHTGFILSDSAGIRFVHSSYKDPWCVVSEEPGSSRILAASRYRVLGKLTGDRGFLRAWLKGAGAGE